MTQRKYTYPIPGRLNLALCGVLMLYNLSMLLLLPFLLRHSLWYALLWMPALFLTSTYWSLVHDATHKSFYANVKVNEACGRLMSVVFGSPFTFLRFGHLMHHRFSRTTPADQTEVYHPEKDFFVLRQCFYYFWLTIGLYLSEFFAPLITFLPVKLLRALVRRLLKESPELANIVCAQLLQKKSLSKFRQDAVIVYLLFLLSFILYAQYGWILVGTLLVRGFIVSTADNLPHYGTPLNQVLYSYNMRAHPIWQKILLNFNYHRAHHNHPKVSWKYLPEVFEATDGKLDVGYWAQWRRQFRGLIAAEELEASEKD